MPTFARALCLCRQLNFSMKLSRNNKLRQVSLFFKGIAIHVLYLLKGKIHRRLHPKCRSMHLLFLLGPLISHLLSILAPTFSLPTNVLHCASSCPTYMLFCIYFPLTFFQISTCVHCTWVQVATLLDYFVVWSKKHQEVSQLPQGRDRYLKNCPWERGTHLYTCPLGEGYPFTHLSAERHSEANLLPLAQNLKITQWLG